VFTRQLISYLQVWCSNLNNEKFINKKNNNRMSWAEFCMFHVMCCGMRRTWPPATCQASCC
jgi:hypothetical protein